MAISQLRENTDQVIKMFSLTNNQLNVDVKLGRFIGAVILKPTYVCNADCDYCFVPPQDNRKWSVDEFKAMFDRLEPVLQPDCTMIWHGGEMMMLSPSFYDECSAYIKSKLPNANIAMQSNLTRYSTAKWKGVVDKHFNSSVSTSYDADEVHRTINGDPALYAKRFKENFKKCLDDGFYCGVITVIDKTNKHTVDSFLNYVLETDAGRNKVAVSINAMLAGGRKEDDETILTPIEYADVLISVLERWNREKLSLDIEPLTNFLNGYFDGAGDMRCGNNSSCARGIVFLENDGSVLTCDELKGISGDEYVHGNILTNSLSEIFTSKSFLKLASRAYMLPNECHQCETFTMCRGGCPRHVLQNGNDISAKDPRCLMFKKIHNKIKEMDKSGDLSWIKKFLAEQ